MIYGLRHRTTYTYEDPVTFARCVLRLTPQSSAIQTVLRSTVEVTPRPSMESAPVAMAVSSVGRAADLLGL